MRLMVLAIFDQFLRLPVVLEDGGIVKFHLAKGLLQRRDQHQTNSPTNARPHSFLSCIRNLRRKAALLTITSSFFSQVFYPASGSHGCRIREKTTSDNMLMSQAPKPPTNNLDIWKKPQYSGSILKDFKSLPKA